MGCVQSYFKRAHNTGLSPSSTQDSNSKAGGNGEIQVGDGSEKENKTSLSNEKLPEEPESNDTSYGVEATAVRTLAATTGTVAILGTTAKTGEKSKSQTDLTEDTDDIELSIDEKNDSSKSPDNKDNSETNIKQTDETNKRDEKINVSNKSEIKNVIIENEKQKNTATLNGASKQEESNKLNEISNVPEQSAAIENHVKADINTAVENSSDIQINSIDAESEKTTNEPSLKQTTTAVVENVKSSDSESGTSVLVNGEINNSLNDKDDVCSSEDNIDEDEERPATVVEIEKDKVENECKSRSSVSENSGSDDTKGINDDISSEQLRTNSFSDTTLSESFNAELDSVKQSPEAKEEINIGEEQTDDAIIIENLSLTNRDITEIKNIDKQSESPVAGKTSQKENRNDEEKEDEEQTTKAEIPENIAEKPQAEIKEQVSVSVTPTNQEKQNKIKDESIKKPEQELNTEKAEVKEETITPETLKKVESVLPEKDELPSKADEDNKLESAATTIQATFRGYQTRQTLLKKENEADIGKSKSKEEMYEPETKTEKEDTKLENAATTIQATFRGYQTRQTLQKKENDIDIEKEETKEEKPKIEVTNAEKDDKSLFEDETLAQAATTIQATFRGYQTRQNLQNRINDGSGDTKLSEEDTEYKIKTEEPTSLDRDNVDKTLENAATTIQATFRGYQTRQSLQNKTNNIAEDTKLSKEDEEEDKIKTEKLGNLDKKYNVDKTLENAATTIQASFRGYQTRQNLQKPDSEKNSEEHESIKDKKDQIVEERKEIEKKESVEEKKEIVEETKKIEKEESVEDVKASTVEEETKESAADNDKDKESLENAATTIQAAFKGYQVRQNIEKQKITENDSDEIKDEINIDPVTRISIKQKSEKPDESKIDEKVTSKENEKVSIPDSSTESDKTESEERDKLESPVPINIQSSLKSSQPRKNLEKRVTIAEDFMEESPVDDEKEFAAATKIQAGFRGFQVRKKLQDDKIEDEDESTEPPISLTPEVIESVKEEVDDICKQAVEATENMIRCGTDVLFRAKLGSGSRNEDDEESGSEIFDSEQLDITEAAHKTVQSIVEEAEQIADERLNSAATKIQASFRGFQARKNLDKTEEADGIPDFPPSTDEDYLFGTPVLDEDLPPPDFEALESSYSEEVATEPLDIPPPLENLPIPESEEVSEASTEVNDDDLRYLQRKQECDELKKTKEFETSSEGESSLSSAATKIQAGVRGYLTRKHINNQPGGTTSTSGASIPSSDQSLGDLGSSKDEDGPVKSMISTEEETEICRHPSTPEKSEQRPSSIDSKLSKKRMSLDSRLIVYPASKNARPMRAMSVSSPRDDISNEQVWQTLQQELSTAATRIQSNYRGYRARKQLTRGDAVQMATTSTSATGTTTPSSGSLDGRNSRTGGAADRTSGEYHDMIALTPPTITTLGEENEDVEVEEKKEEEERKPSGEGRETPAGDVTAPTSEEESKMVKRRHADISDDNDNKEETDDQGKAATKIQAGFRGYKTRKEMKMDDDKSSKTEKPQSSDNSNNLSESKSNESKSPSTRHSKDAENEAAAKIQAGFRGMKTRQELKAKQNCNCFIFQNQNIIQK
ncbi:uncharacterized protein LOC142325328 isoform X2 [Lycorma delicatula]|uniref:uncharacterized protein LOC142325328 isoform X2 n=1 Tax=Lycorma delicatula TaxID=130591 RepID=UPI003F5136D9